MPAVLDKPEEGKLVQADSRGRVGLGSEATSKSFIVKRASNGDYILTPVIHVPEREAWLWSDNESRASFERGIADIKAGRVKEMDFSAYLTDEDSAEAKEDALG